MRCHPADPRVFGRQNGVRHQCRRAQRVANVVVDLGNRLADIGKPLALAQRQQRVALKCLERPRRFQELARSQNLVRDRTCHGRIVAERVDRIDKRAKRRTVMAVEKQPQRRETGKDHHGQHQQRTREHHPQRLAEISRIDSHKAGPAGPEAGDGKLAHRQSGDQPRHTVEFGGKRELLVEDRGGGKQRNQHRKRKGACKDHKLWSQVTHRVGSRSVPQDSIFRFILARPDFRLMAHAPGTAKPAVPIEAHGR